MSVPQTIPYQGSKRKLATSIMAYLPLHIERFIEPFAGSAALSLALAAQKRVDKIILNDSNAALISLWSKIVNEPKQLSDHYENLWKAQLGNEREFYDKVRERFNKSQRSHYLLYLLARCVKAAVRYNSSGEFNQSPDNRRKGRHYETMRHDILRTSCLLKGKTRLISTDYEFVLALAQPSDIVYLDPPYQGLSLKKDPRYLGGFSHERFIKALHLLNMRQIPYLLSYDGITGNKQHGQDLPNALNCKKVLLDAGVSSQETLLGRSSKTFESLYLSPALMERLDKKMPVMQLSLFGESA